MTPLPLSPEIDWDGESPINGEPVTHRATFAGRNLVFTATSIYRVRLKGHYAVDRVTFTPEDVAVLHERARKP